MRKQYNIIAFYVSLAVALVDAWLGWWGLTAYMIFCAWLNLRAIKKWEAQDESKSDSNSVQ